MARPTRPRAPGRPGVGPGAPEVHVQYATGRRGVPAPASLRRWAGAALAGCPGPAGVTLRVVGREEGAGLNLRYRGKSGATNVLAFPLEAPPGLPGGGLGDVVICAPVVAEEAAQQGKAPAAHWAHLVIHGILHLLGHDHQTEAQAARMEAAEVEVLARLGFGDPYGDRDPP